LATQKAFQKESKYEKKQWSQYNKTIKGSRRLRRR